jgi:hypothetical protein
MTAKNISIAADNEARNARNVVRYTELSDKAKFNSADGAYWSAFAGSTLAGAGVGAGIGAGAGAGIGALAGGVGAAPGAGIGAIVGAVVGAVGGAITGVAAGEAAKVYAQEKDRDDTD